MRMSLHIPVPQFYQYHIFQYFLQEDLNTKYNTLSKKWLLAVLLAGHEFTGNGDATTTEGKENVTVSGKGSLCLQKLNYFLKSHFRQNQLAQLKDRQSHT